MQVISVLLLGCGVFLLSWWILQLVLASPLQPVDSELHDFGIVLIDLPEATVEHTFVLENTTDRPLRILKTVPSCGCTWAGAGEPFLEPGARMELPVTFTVKESHKLDSNIKVVLEDESPLVLWLSARGRLRDSLRHTPRSITIRRSGEGTLGIRESNARLYIEGWDSVRPAEPAFHPPEGLAVEFHGWRLVKQGKERLGTPDLYEGNLKVTATGDPPNQVEIPVFMPGGQETTLLVNGDSGMRGGGYEDRSWVPGAPDITFDPEVPVEEPAAD